MRTSKRNSVAVLSSLRDEPVALGKQKKYMNKKTDMIAQKYLLDCMAVGRMPFLEELALNIGVSVQTICNWNKKHESFKKIYSLIQTLQKLELKRQGLRGFVDPRLVMLLLSADHDVIGVTKNQTTPDSDLPDTDKGMTPDQRKAYADEITRVFNEIYSQPAQIQNE